MLTRSIAYRRLAALALAGFSLAMQSASATPLDPGPDEALLYYQRADGDYNGWGPHLWNTPWFNWAQYDASWSSVFDLVAPSSVLESESLSPASV